MRRKNGEPETGRRPSFWVLLLLLLALVGVSLVYEPEPDAADTGVQGPTPHATDEFADYRQPPPPREPAPPQHFRKDGGP